MHDPNSTAILLIAHGSRRPEANADLEYFAEAIRLTGQYCHVQSSYLEIAKPSIVEGGDQCVRPGVSRVFMIPFFLSPGRHATEDMDDARQRLAEKHPNVEFRCAPALGRHPLLVQILLERARDLESAAAHD